MALNLGSRIVSAIAQLYAITIFLKHHNPETASVIILLIGYLSWFQLFEFGLSQTIQNKFNLKKLSLNNIISITLIHNIILMTVGMVVWKTNLVSNVLLSNASNFTASDKANFSLGAGLLILTSSNLILHRILLITRKGNQSNLLLLVQSIVTIISLFIYSHTNYISQINSIIVYVIPQVAISIPVLILLGFRKIKVTNKQYKKINILELCKSSFGFFSVSALSSVLLGMDYFFLSRYANSNEIIAYHVTTRFFYKSIIFYYSYLINASKKIATVKSENTLKKIREIKRNTILLGSTSAICVYLLILFINKFGYMYLISNNTKISNSLAITALIYFLVRVYCDTNLVITNNLSLKKKLIQTYTLQIFVSGILMPFLIPFYGALGALVALTIAYLVGLTTQPKIQ
jgi:hypothetical protein